MINADPTGAFSGVQAVIMGIVVVSAVVTFGLYALGLPAGLTGLAFVVSFAVLMGAGWTRIKDAHPRYDRTSRE